MLGIYKLPSRCPLETDWEDVQKFRVPRQENSPKAGTQKEAHEDV